MAWKIAYHDDYLAELLEETENVQDAVFAAAEMLQHSGPQLQRPYADTLHGSKFSNMKELRITVPDGEWRVAYAFDPIRRAILLADGSKSGGSSKRFYRRLIRTADQRYQDHLSGIKEEEK